MIQVRRLGHATLATPDLEKQVDYWTSVIGLKLVDRGKDHAHLATKLGQEAIALERGASQLTKYAFQVGPDGDLGELAAALQKAGVSVERRNDISPGVAEAIAFRDPDGVLIEVFADAKFHGHDKSDTGIGPLKFGHVAHRVTDVQKHAAFYTDILGFRMSDWIGDHFVFLRCGPDHHTVNFVGGKTTRMHHIAFELKDWAHVQTACDFLGGRNIDIIWGPGRHGPGHNVFTYHRNPDDQIVELFTEMDKMLDESLGYFDPRPWHRERPQRPKVWQGMPRDIWGPPPTKDYIRQRE
jgi:catechol 2,3-dioxygenase-like lactoylglutathione lyase family enzyme